MDADDEVVERPSVSFRFTQDHIERHVGRYLTMLFADPVKTGLKLESLELVGIYKYPEQKKHIAEAVALWSAFYAKSAFYERIANRFHRRNYEAQTFSEYDFGRTVNVLVSSLRGKLHDFAEKSTNFYVRAFAMYMLLPESVARRWLWHANIDFQTPEAFLRRLQSSQYDSLQQHYELWKNNTPMRSYPCFTDGTLNKVWDALRLEAAFENRLAPKSAIAYDFLGFNMGFQKYPELTNDASANDALVSLFLSSQNRGSFEVNKEEGGLYWWLYRTLRSNRLYGKNKDVQLGRYICPGFWFTMIAWFIFLVLSPLALASAGILYATTSSLNPGLIALGAITPIIWSAGWIREHLFSNQFDDEYWGKAFKMYAYIVGALLFSFAYHKLSNFYSWYALLAGVVLLGPYCWKRNLGAFWQVPYLGKTLTFLFLFMMAEDLWRFTMFWEGCLDVLKMVFAYLAANLWFVLMVIASLALYCGFLFGAMLLLMHTNQKMFAAVEHKQVQSEAEFRREKRMYYSLLFAGMGFVTLAFYSIPGKNIQDYATATLLLVLALAPFGVSALHTWANKKLDPKVAIVYQWFLEYGFHSHIQATVALTIATNKFWFEKKPLRLKAKKLWFLYNNTRNKDQFLLCASMVSSEEEWKRLCKVLVAQDMKHLRAMLLYGNDLLSREVLQVILRGSAKRDDLEEKIRTAEEMKRAKKLRRGAFLDGVAGVFMFAWFIVSSPFRVIIRIIKDVYKIWQAFNQFCPPSPPEARGSFR